MHLDDVLEEYQWRASGSGVQVGRRCCLYIYTRLTRFAPNYHLYIRHFEAQLEMHVLYTRQSGTDFNFCAIRSHSHADSTCHHSHVIWPRVQTHYIPCSHFQLPTEQNVLDIPILLHISRFAPWIPSSAIQCCPKRPRRH